MKKIANNDIFVLIACEKSQAECKAFRQLGFQAFSCDIERCVEDGNPDWHIVGDVTPYLHGQTRFTTQSAQSVQVPKWHMIIAHPPCTFLCKAGAVQMFKNCDGWRRKAGKWTLLNTTRYDNMMKARAFFMECLYAKAEFIAVENPIPMAAAMLGKPDCFACPTWFGSKYSKKTYYWTKNLPPLMAEEMRMPEKSYVFTCKGEARSRTYPGLARAIARQWGLFVCEQLNIQLKKTWNI